MVPLLLVGVRLGTLLALGALPSRMLNRLAQVAVGACTGIAVITAWTWLLGGTDVQSSIWTLLVPVSVGIANAFSIIDSGAPIPASIFGRFVPRASLAVPTLVLLAFLLILILPLYRIRARAAEAKLLAQMTSDEPTREVNNSLEIQRLPARIEIDLKFPQKVAADLILGKYKYDLEMLILRGGLVVKSFDDPEKFEESLDSGKYQIVIAQFGFYGYRGRLIFPVIFQRMLNRFHLVRPTASDETSIGSASLTNGEVPTLKVSLNVLTSKVPVQDRPPPPPQEGKGE